MAETKPTRKAKRFQPELVETSVQSSKTRRREVYSTRNEPYDDGRPPPVDSTVLSGHARRRAEHLSRPEVQVIACSSDGSSDGSRGELKIDRERLRPPRRFAPQPVETVKSSRRQERDPDVREPGKARSRGSSEPRRFTPQLIETAKRSFRHVGPALTRGPGTHPAPSEQTGAATSKDLKSPTRAPSSLESRFSYANLLQREQSRRHSFRVPDLPAIPSNSSGDSRGSGTPSLSTSPSASSDESLKRPSVTAPSRESCDERFSGHLLSIAARSVEKQLREQTLAAFPNEQVYQPPAHFAIDKEDEEDSEEDAARDDRVDVLPNLRRESSVDLTWQLENMRQYKEEAEMRERAMFATNASPRTPTATPVLRESNHGHFNYAARVTVGRKNNNNVTSPPMLGADLVFPQSLSPEGTACEGDQDVPQTEANNKDACIKCGGLWCSTPRVTAADRGGLWMGTCRKEEESPAVNGHLRPGLVTPKAVADRDSWLSLDESLSQGTGACLPPLPSDGDSRLEDLDRKLSLEDQSLSEFNDEFVTQIYDYLSLGYPCVARYFDEELSKISGIPVGELRRDDLNTDAKGHVGVSDAASADKGFAQGACMRWKALRSYIHEWARQQPGMVDNDCNVETWGVRERRGSWAI